MSIKLNNSATVSGTETVTTTVPGGESTQLTYAITHNVKSKTYSGVYSQALPLTNTPTVIDLSAAQYPSQAASEIRDLINGQLVVLLDVENTGAELVLVDFLTAADAPIARGAWDVPVGATLYVYTPGIQMLANIGKISLAALTAAGSCNVLVASETPPV